MRLTVEVETWPITGEFRIARGAKSQAHVVVVTVEADGARGRGECVPYARYGETIEAVTATIRAIAGLPLTRADLALALPPGAARNAVDCALWDWQAKREGRPVWQLAGLPEPRPLITAYTLSLGPAEAMGRAAREASGRPLLKLKLGGDGADPDRVAAVRENAPGARLIVDANEGWTVAGIEKEIEGLLAYDIALIEQPLPADVDRALEAIESPIPLCADESCHDRRSLDRIGRRYDCINVKLDKTGGLTEAIAMLREIEESGLKLMVGCMVGTSLAMAPAALIAQGADFVDLDGPLLLARDRQPGLRYEGSILYPADPALWG